MTRELLAEPSEPKRGSHICAAHRHAVERLERVSRIYRALSDTNEAIIRATTETELFQRVCDITAGLGGLQIVWIATRDPDRHVLVPAATAGPAAEWIRRNEMPLDPEAPGGTALACEVFRTGVTLVRDDYFSDPLRAYWYAATRTNGIVSACCLPLRLRGEVVGVFCMGAATPGYFDADVVGLLEGMVRDLSFGLDHIAREAELRQTEEQLRIAQKMEAIGQLAGGVAHDFNNLLMVIGSYTELATEALPDDHPARADLQEVCKATARASGLTRQLLAFSRKQVLRPQVLDLNVLLAGLEKMLAPLLGEDVELVLDPCPELGSTKADAGQIEQVIMNLAVNARDAMRDGGTLGISTANVDLDDAQASRILGLRAGPYVRVTVSDTGTGMSEAIRAHIFEPFFTTKPKDKGTGLGLATVYGIVQQSGGGIGVDSELGKGTSFEIFLPRLEEGQPISSPPSEPSKRQTGTETILLVEDELAVRCVAQRLLRAAGYTVLTAASGAEALHLGALRAADLSLLISDVVMPGMNGRDLADRLKVQQPNLKVLYISGYTDDAILHRGVQSEAAHFLSKPFSADTLLQRVRAMLDSARPAGATSTEPARADSP